MKRLENILAALTPKRWPVRWRLAAVSATLTLIILVVFAVVVGRLVEQPAQRRLQRRASGHRRPARLGAPGHRQGRMCRRIRGRWPLGATAVRVVDRNGNEFRGGATLGAPNLGPPGTVGGFSNVGSLRVFTTSIPTSVPVQAYLQYARSTDSLDATISRLWLFLGGGVLGGTLLAALAGIAIAGRAMRPVSTLTATAREIASTRDPSLRIPGAGDRRRGGRAGPHAGPDASRARRGALRDRADDAGAARVRRRRLARAAHAR